MKYFKYIIYLNLFLFIGFHNIYAIRDTLTVKSLKFIENKNQWNGDVLYAANLNYGMIFIEKKGLTFNIVNPNDILHSHAHHGYKKNHNHKHNKVNHFAYQIEFLNCNDAKINAYEKSNDYYNFFIGKDSKNWANFAYSYQTLEYKNLYEKIDLKIYSQNNSIKYDYILHPGANSSEIKLKYKGVKKIFIKKSHLIIETSFNQILELRPYCYQIINGLEKEVNCNYVLKNNILTFELGEYDRSFPLIIDPALIFSTYTGSTADNWGFTACNDLLGNVYAGGIVFQIGYPVSLGAYQTVSGGGWDIGIIKYDSSGIYRLYATYLGGSSTDVPHSIVVNKANQLLILGTTGSSNYPVKSNAYDTSFNGGVNIALDNVLQYPNGSDIVVSKLSSNGSQLLASTFVGGSGNDGLNYLPHYNNMLMFGNDTLYYNYGDGVRGEIITDNKNNVYIGTCTFSTDFPGTSNGFQSISNGKQEGIVFKMDYNLTNLIWSSYLGGSENDAIYSIDNNSDYDVYVTGGTTSINFPTTQGAYKTNYQGGTTDGFISKISQNGSLLKSSTFFGSNKYDQSYFIRVGKNNDVFITGQTRSDSNTLIYNAPYNIPNSGQFIAKFKPNLDSIIWSTVIGTGDGKPNLSPTAFAVDVCNRIYLVGWGRYWGDYTHNGITYSWGTVFGTVNMPITSNAFQNVTDGQDFYILVISNDASNLEYASYFGEIHSGPNYSGHDHVDGGTSRFDRKGTVYQSVCASCGGFNMFPTFPANVWSPTNGSLNCNNAVFKFKVFDNFALADFIDPLTGCAPDTISFQNASLGSSFIWDFGDGSPISTQNNPTHVYTNAGIYQVKLIAFMPNGCIASDTIIKQIVILSDTTYNLPDAHICFGDNKQIGINPINNPSYNYNWSPSSFLSDPSISNPFSNAPSNTTYRLIVSNGSCSDTIFQKVKVYKMIVDAGNDTLVCNDTVKLTAYTNEFPVNYIWSTNSNFTDTLNINLTDSSAIINFSNNAYYYVKIFNQWCEGIDSVYVGFSILTGPSLVNHPSCKDSCNGSISIIPSGGTPPYNFQWNTGQTSSMINNLCAGNYTVTIIDSLNCKSIKTFNIINPPPLVINKNITHIPCPTACIGKIQASVNGGTMPYQYLWSNSSNQNTISSLCAGNYTLIVTDNKNCKLFDTTEIVVNSPFLNVIAWADKDTIFKDLSTQLHVTGVNNVNIQWVPSTGLNNPFSFNPIASPSTTTTYYFTLTDPYGCTYTDSLTIYVIDQICDEPYIFIPNAFTPNNDLQNDVFLVRSEILEEMNIKIFNRWGEKIFESNNINLGWDGRYKGEFSEPAVYVYYFKGKCQNQKYFEKKGNVTLIR